MAKVEDVAGTAVGSAENLFDSEFEDFNGCEEGDGVEVALHGVAVADGAPTFVEGLTPVKTNDVGTG